jgi:hypothetical protein
MLTKLLKFAIAQNVPLAAGGHSLLQQTSEILLQAARQHEI